MTEERPAGFADGDREPQWGEPDAPGAAAPPGGASPAGASTSRARASSDWTESDIERLRTMIGGKRDMIDGAVPAIVFVVANAVWSLTVAAIASAAYGVAMTLYRLARRQDPKRALIGLGGLGIAVVIALWTGSASAYFVPGVILGFLFGILTLLTVAFKQPTSAVFAMALEGKPPEYYKHPKVLRAHMIVTTVWALVFLARAGFRAYLIANDQTTLLGASAIVLGYPVTLGLAAGTVLYIRRALKDVQVDPQPAAPDHPADSA